MMPLHLDHGHSGKHSFLYNENESLLRESWSNAELVGKCPDLLNLVTRAAAGENIQTEAAALLEALETSVPEIGFWQ
jgi:predicted transcriptional regulator